VEGAFCKAPGFAPRLLSERHRLYQAQSGLIHHPKRFWGQVRSSKFLFALAANGVIWRQEQCAFSNEPDRER
jgi:hypothetical protein